MIQYNLTSVRDLESAYAGGLLPQRNQKNVFYQDTSCRSDLGRFALSSENRRIIRKTENYHCELIPLDQFSYTPSLQKQIKGWITALKWDFPISSVRTVFTAHVFNYVAVWTDAGGKSLAYAVCLITKNISHIAYLFYDPIISHQDILIRIVLQFVIDSHNRGLKYAYLGRFSPDSGYYKRNMPGFEYYNDSQWQTLS